MKRKVFGRCRGRVCVVLQLCWSCGVMVALSVRNRGGSSNVSHILIQCFGRPNNTNINSYIQHPRTLQSRADQPLSSKSDHSKITQNASSTNEKESSLWCKRYPKRAPPNRCHTIASYTRTKLCTTRPNYHCSPEAGTHRQSSFGE
jgi:hypothetical protein